MPPPFWRPQPDDGQMASAAAAAHGGGPSFAASASNGGAGGSSNAAGGSSTIASQGGAAGTGAGGAASPAPVPPPRVGPEVCNTLRQLDPDEVYLIGTLTEGSCGADALTHWANPNLALTGFGCYNRADAAIVRPSDHALLISDSSAGVTVFQEDACVLPELSFGDASNPLANDGQLSSPCAMPAAFVGSTLELAPSGEAAYWCGAGWYSSSGQLLYSGVEEVYAYDGERLLTQEGVFDIAQQVLRPVLALPERAVLTSRVTKDGFWLVLRAEPPLSTELWHIARDGRAERVGDYPEPPVEASTTYIARVAPDGALFQFATSFSGGLPHDLILRRSLLGAAEIVYDERNEPLVRIHASGLVTGP
jgi:hypothetical protein